MGTTIALTAKDGFTLSAYKAEPPKSVNGGKPMGGVVVIQEIFGLNGHIRDVADRLAAQGYLCIAPALFDRLKPGIELGYTETDLQEGLDHMQKIGNDKPMMDIQAAAEELRKSVAKVGAIGFCWGGQLAWVAAKSVSLDCSVCYYGIAIHATLQPPPKCEVLIHFADYDAFVPHEALGEIRHAYPDMEIYSYPANHGFNCDRRADYNAEAATEAMERTLEFFRENLSA